MESKAGTTETRSNITASDGDQVAALESLQFTDEFHRLILAPPSDNATSLTALLELPASRALELLHSPASAKLIAASASSFEALKGNFLFPSNTTLIDQAARSSVFAGGVNNTNNKSNAPETTSNNATLNLEKAVKSEPAETESCQPLVSDPAVEKRNFKRKDREKKARREKINARMKLLQELVPGCNKISGTALVLDEIINHVQSLQNQVEFLSMRLAAVNPRTDFNLNSIFTTEFSAFFRFGGN
uniref:BHLH domain-containing protein n=1 Tax=Gossypium raimondii TaxID=29730 RepID=A0A0D2S375_GOSRA|nr:hypothetical protein B456_006G139900 [Gossypium raimondii]